MIRPNFPKKASSYQKNKCLLALSTILLVSSSFTPSHAEPTPETEQREKPQQGAITIPIGQPKGVNLANHLPSRGLTRQQVLKQFGAPVFWQDDVGEPPITHWRYPAYSVYFENNRVIHTVQHKP